VGIPPSTKPASWRIFIARSNLKTGLVIFPSNDCPPEELQEILDAAQMRLKN